MKPLKLTCIQLKSGLRNNLSKTRDAWKTPPEAGQKKALDHSRALALKRRDSKKIAQLVTRVHWQLHRQRLPHSGHPHSNTRVTLR